jgi:hypothetical protein
MQVEEQNYEGIALRLVKHAEKIGAASEQKSTRISR